MGWGIGLTQIFNRTGISKGWPQRDRRSDAAQFRALAIRLLLSYLGAMGVVIGTLTGVIYQFVAHTIDQEIDERLGLLADAAAHELPAILMAPTSTPGPSHRRIDNDGDLDLPWQTLQQQHQSIEWFDATHRRVAIAGQGIPNRPFIPQTHRTRDEDSHSLTLAVYGTTSGSRQVQGYVRVTEWLEEDEEELERLLAGMAWGGGAAALVMAGTGWWLTRRSLQPIERNFRQLQQFTADASHELRSPLTAIRTAVDVMQHHPERVHPADAPKLAAIANSARQMTALVDDLLLLARADRQATALTSTGRRIPLDELLDDLVEHLQAQAIAKSVKLTASTIPEIWVQGEATQLRRLFLNLLENAIQYTPAGGQVQVKISPVDPSYDTVWIQVSDTGIGIAPEHLPLVFDRFWRADQARSRHSGGSGLGLAIARAIALAHGGDITVSSQLHQGSCFQVELPLAA